MIIKRDFYLNQIIDRMWDGRIKVITGIRRGGKSTLLFTLFKEYLVTSLYGEVCSVSYSPGAFANRLK